MFRSLKDINSRPDAFEFYTAADLWTDPHTSEKMLAYHLDTEVDLSSRRGEFIDQSVEWIGSHFNVNSNTRMADFGCGPGLYTSRFARYGASVTGIDFSERSINYAQKKARQSGLSINYIHQNYLDFNTEERFNIITMIMCDFCALSPLQRKTLLEKFYSLLLPGGCVLLDVYSLNAYDQRQEVKVYEENLHNGLWSADEYFGFLNTFKYDDVKVILDKYTLVEEKRIRTVYNWLQYFTPGSLKSEFETAGFVRNQLYGNVAGAPFDESESEFAIVARK